MELFKNIGFVMKRIGIYAKKAVLLVSMFNVMMAVVDNTYVLLLNGLYEKIASRELGKGMIFIFFLAGTMMLMSDLLNGILNYFSARAICLLEQGYQENLFACVEKVEPYGYLQAERLDRIKAVREGKDGTVLFYFNLMMILTHYIPYFLGLLVFLCLLSPVLAVVLVLSFLPSIFSWKVRRCASYTAESQSGIHKRRMEAYHSYVGKFPWLQETRFWKMDEEFIRRFQEEAGEYKRLRTSFYKDRCLLDCLCALFYVLGIAVTLGTLTLLVKQRVLTGAEVATVLTVVLSVYEKMNAVMNQHVTALMDYTGSLRLMKEFMETTDCESEVARKTSDKGFIPMQEVSLDQVCFRYPDGKGDVLKSISLSVQTGDVIAIVGENGSGKTTLSKILSTMFLPDSGSMSVNGVPVQKQDIPAIRSRISTVQQDFQHYPFTIGENILLEDADQKEEQVQRLLAQVDLTRKMDSNIRPSTLASKEFGGVELSGGQWQRIAIARAASKDSDMLIFDEPTSAIDPIEEVRIMELLLSLCQNKIAILITHRIGCAKMANKILVMQDGVWCEQGTHRELMEKQGKYYQMYKLQEQWYTE